MANATSVQITNDGPQNVTAYFTGSLDTFPLAGTVILDPALLTPTDPKTKQLRVDTIDYVLQDGLTLSLAWDATTPVPFLDLYGRGNISTGKTESGFNNNAGVGKTGKIIATSNSPTPGTYTFTVVLWCKKQ
jgi:hypothetical protein